MTPEDKQRAIATIDGYVRRDVDAGFLSEPEIVESISMLLSDEFDTDKVKPLVGERTKHFLALHYDAALSWPATTDCDKLDRALSVLESRGIVCRQNFSCCGTCGAGEIGDEMDQVRAQGGLVRGYAFYHMQDTEAAVEGTGLYLAYGATDEGELAALRIGHEICDAIRGEGLEIDWDGSWDKRIAVKLDWKKRRQPRCSLVSTLKCDSESQRFSV